MKKVTLALFATLMISLVGCAMTGDDSASTGSTPKNVDALHMRNGDILVGELALSEIQLSTEYLSRVTLEPRHIESLEFEEEGRAKVVTRYGDVLHGRLDLQDLRLRSKTGQDLLVPVKEVDRITFAE